MHPNIVELICHRGVTRIKQVACASCPRLKRLVIPGVEVVESYAFNCCKAVTYVECDSLEVIEDWAFNSCESLGSIDLPSVKVIEKRAFNCCYNMKHAKFGTNLESIGQLAFRRCRSLERITFPLKNGFIIDDNLIFVGCESLKQVDFVEDDVLRETAAALLMEDWRNDMNELIDSINKILPNISAPSDGSNSFADVGAKGRAIRQWISRVLLNICYYKARHSLVMDVVEDELLRALPGDIAKESVLPFLQVPTHTFQGEDIELDVASSDEIT